MNLREVILTEHTKANCDRIVKWIGNRQERFDELFRYFLKDKDPVVIQRAAWPLSNAVINHPGLIQKHLGALLKNLSRPNLHDAVRRNSIRLLEVTDIPEKFHGTVMNVCFDYISSPEEKTVAKVYALTVLENLSKIYPDIKQELKTVIENRWDHEGAAFRARARHILRRISKS